MLEVTLYSIVSVIIVSLISIAAAIPLLIQKKVSKKTLLIMLSVSVGVLLSTVFMSILPEAFLHGYSMWMSIQIILGFLVMFMLEKLVHWHHSKDCEDDHVHSHAYSLAPINIMGDAIHNFIDGMVIAGSYAVNISVGIAATISIILHEVPQEIADFGVLLYSGLSKKKALLFNLLSAVTAIIGTIVGLLLYEKSHAFSEFILPFAAGNFLYIAASNLLPQLHRHCKLKDTLIHLIAIIFGILVIVLITSFGVGHTH